MKILHVIEIRGIGGAETMLVEFLGQQVKVGLKVNCILLCQSNFCDVTFNINEQLKLKGVKTTIIVFSKLNAFSLIKMCFSVIKTTNADVIHTHLRVAEILLALYKFWDKNLKIVTTVHGYSDNFQNEFSSGRKRNVKLTLRYYLVKFINSQIDGLVLISKFILKFYTDNDLINKKNKIAQIDNARTANFSNNATVYNFPKNTIKIILPGRLIECKGHKYAFEAVKILLSNHKIILDCYGIGPYEEVLGNLIFEMGLQEHVFLKGFSKNIVSVMQNYDVVVIPSLFESFGLVFLDAFLAKVPVVAFDLPAGNEVIKNDVTGLLAEPRDSISLATNIESLIYNKPLSNLLINNAFNDLKTRFSIERMVEKYHQFYLQILKF